MFVAMVAAPGGPQAIAAMLLCLNGLALVVISTLSQTAKSRLLIGFTAAAVFICAGYSAGWARYIATDAQIVRSSGRLLLGAGVIVLVLMVYACWLATLEAVSIMLPWVVWAPAVAVRRRSFIAIGWAGLALLSVLHALHRPRHLGARTPAPVSPPLGVYGAVNVLPSTDAHPRHVLVSLDSD